MEARPHLRLETRISRTESEGGKRDRALDESGIVRSAFHASETVGARAPPLRAIVQTPGIVSRFRRGKCHVCLLVLTGHPPSEAAVASRRHQGCFHRHAPRTGSLRHHHRSCWSGAAGQREISCRGQIRVRNQPAAEILTTTLVVGRLNIGVVEPIIPRVPNTQPMRVGDSIRCLGRAVIV